MPSSPGCRRCLPGALQRPDVSRISIAVGIQAHQVRPVPTGADGKHRVKGGGGLVATESKEAECSEFVQGSVIGSLRQCVFGLLQRRCIVTLTE